MSFFFSFLLILFSACSSNQRAPLGESSERFLLKDRSGEFIVLRNVKQEGKKLVVKREVFNPADLNNPLEKTITVSVMGNLKTKDGYKKGLRPEVAQHAIWYEKNKFFSQSKINTKKKTLDIIMKSPEEKWNGKKSFQFPKGRVFCFFSQLPECLRRHGYLSTEEKKPYHLQVVWDSFPYHQEMYENVSADPFEAATWAFDKKSNGGYRFGLLLNGQLVIYEFDIDFKFKNMFWVLQGITLNKQKDNL